MIKTVKEVGANPTGKNQRGETICAFRRDMRIPGRGQAVEDRLETY